MHKGKNTVFQWNCKQSLYTIRIPSRWGKGRMNQLIQSWLLKLKTQLVHPNGTQFVEKSYLCTQLKKQIPPRNVTLQNELTCSFQLHVWRTSIFRWDLKGHNKQIPGQICHEKICNLTWVMKMCNWSDIQG